MFFHPLLQTKMPTNSLEINVKYCVLHQTMHKLSVSISLLEYIFAKEHLVTYNKSCM